jgi:hypothetical protein
MSEERKRTGQRGVVAEALLDQAIYGRLPKPTRRPDELDFSQLAGPRRDNETLAEFAARYRRMNDQLENKYGGGVSRVEADPIQGHHVIQCSVCAATGPVGSTLHEAARFAQENGFVHLRDEQGRSIRGGPHNYLVWVCTEHAEADRQAAAQTATNSSTER